MSKKMRKVPNKIPVNVIKVWSDGNVVRKYVGQDKKCANGDIVNKTPEKGYRIMLCALYELNTYGGNNESE